MKGKQKIVVVDYGVGNLYSLEKALALFSKDVVISDDAEIISNAGALILPGVGAFVAGMAGLEIRKLIEPIRKFAKSGKPILGICLGAQILLDKGYEFEEHQGLGLISGKVLLFPDSVKQNEKLPQIGWNEIAPPKGISWKKTILNGVKERSSVYFVHSYILVPENEEDIFALSLYGGLSFCAAVRKGNVYGTQFHPEKSSAVGLAILKNFVNLV